ncbi:uncharacterized protein TNCV_2984801 [Trichonephila clavipes]|nr:uncharacterized protein TNCV_2984801 [Trichonephila clavipes]
MASKIFELPTMPNCHKKTSIKEDQFRKKEPKKGLSVTLAPQTGMLKYDFQKSVLSVERHDTDYSLEETVLFTLNIFLASSEIQGDLHNGAQRINTENRVGSGFRIIPEQYFSGVENINDFLENIDNNLAYYEIPAQLACAYLKGHLKGRALDWFEVLGYRVIEDKATDYAHLKRHCRNNSPWSETCQN